MALRIAERASRTDVGRQRQSNEDAYLERPPLFAVADGMGGAQAGEVASRLAVRAFDAPPASDGGLEDQLRAVARAANREIYDRAQEDSARAGMGTTLTAVLVHGRELAVGHVGDSRLYRLRDGQLERLTDDHSLVEELVRQRKLTPEAAEVHPQRSIITRALGPEPDVEVDTHTHTARPGDVYLLCSDGLTGMVPEPDVRETLLSSSSLAEAADRLVAAANAAGGRDNITVVLFRLADDEAAVDEGETLSGGISASDVRAAVAEREATRVTEAERTLVRPRAATTAPRPRARHRGAATGAILALLVVALAVGAYIASRQFWFIGTNARGQVTLYRGLPYDLPLGLHLYSQQYQSSVPAVAIADTSRRAHIIDHQLRSHGDAVDVLRQLESTASRP